jgi:hypothetical protein
MNKSIHEEIYVQWSLNSDTKEPQTNVSTKYENNVTDYNAWYRYISPIINFPSIDFDFNMAGKIRIINADATILYHLQLYVLCRPI